MGVFHKLSMTIALISLMALLLPFPVARADEAVTFPDPHLQARIREAIGKPTGDIYLSDLKGLNTLNANSAGITDLSGLEYCTSLTYLSLAYNEISDISQLSKLTSLNYLNLHVNRISDLSPNLRI
jgi:internalin A